MSLDTNHAELAFERRCEALMNACWNGLKAGGL